MGNSAECVVERPELAGRGYQPVTDYGTVKFTWCVGSDYRTFTDATPEEVDVVDGIQWNVVEQTDPQVMTTPFWTKRYNLVVGSTMEIHSTAPRWNDNGTENWIGIDTWTHH